MTFSEYIVAQPVRSKDICDFYLGFLSEFSNKRYPFEDELKLRGVADKFVKTVCYMIYVEKKVQDDYYEKLEALLTNLRYFRRLDTYFELVVYFPINRKKRLLLKIQNSFQELFSKTIEFISALNNEDPYRDFLEINGFYNPDNSNKLRIKELILEAIELIKYDSTLSEKSKNKLVGNLSNIIENLDREHVDWIKFLGKIKETVIVLGALGSLMGGISPILTARDKLEETAAVIQQTSINLNFNVINQTFNAPKVIQLTNLDKFLQLPENTEVIIKEKDSD